MRRSFADARFYALCAALHATRALQEVVCEEVEKVWAQLVVVTTCDRLPARVRDCKREYDQVAFAFRDLIGPHIDHELAKRVLDKTWLPDVKARSSRN